MSYHGKFIDRLPIICAAGAPSIIVDSVKILTQSYPPEDHLEYLVNREDKREQQRKIKVLAKPTRPTTFDGIQDCISPTAKTKFEEFYDKVYEAKYESHKNRPLGKCRQSIAKPDSITNENTTFGRKNIREGSLYDLVLPNKIPFQVQFEWETAHEKYRLSHQNFYPSERINRKYKKPAFDEKQTFGKRSNVVLNGKLTKRALEDICNPEYFYINNTVQHEFIDRYRSKVGKPLQTNRILKQLPPDYTFGTPSESDRFSSEELIYSRAYYEKRAKILESLKYLNGIRTALKKRIGYDLEDMNIELEEMDTDFTGELALEIFFCIMKDHKLQIDKDCLIVLLKHFNMLKDNDKVNIKDFLKLIDCRHELPNVGRLDDVFLPTAAELTTYRNLTHDVYKNDPACKVQPAGLPSQSIELVIPKVHEGMIRADIESLTEETDVHALLSQSIPTMFGLSHRDYFMPRSKDEIRTIFSNIGYDLQDHEKFHGLWCDALKHWTCKNQMVSVEAFRCSLKMSGEEKK